MGIATSWWDALGHEVSEHGFKATFDLLVSEGVPQEEAALGLQIIAREIRHDNPQRAFTMMRTLVGDGPNKFNETFVMRALATLVAPKDGDYVDDLTSLLGELA